jgi:cytochrome P450
MQFELDGTHLRLDPRDPAFYNDPYPFYEQIRARTPVAYWENFNVWAYVNHDDVSALLRDRRFGRQLTHLKSREELGWPPVRDELRPFYDVDDLQMLQLEPPNHTRLRNLVQKSFMSRQIETMRPKLAALCDALIDEMQATGEVDLLTAYATPLPVIAIAQLLGVPVEMKDWLLSWSHKMVQMYMLGHTREQELEAVQATQEFVAYLRDLVAERRKRPANDLITLLIDAEEAGDKLTEDELISSCILLLNAGHEATVNVIGNGMSALLTHPEQWAKLVAADAAPGLVQSAVEEMLRWDPPLHYFHRWAMEDDLEYKGKRFKMGDTIAVLLGAANRDPQRFTNAQAFDITRPVEANPHVSFGGGIHFCVGAPLARLELQVAVERLVRRVPGLALAEAAEYRNAFGFHGREAVQVITPSAHPAR